MTRKLSIAILSVLLLSLFLSIPALAAKSYYAERFDVQLDLQENGSAIVTETVEFHFSGDPFTYAFREIAATETDGIHFLDASMDGVLMSQGTGAGQVEVQAGDPVKVTWHFPPASDTSHVFTVHYRAEGVIREGAADALIWRAIPEDHEYSIDKSTITLTYPTKAKLLEAPVLSRTFESSSTENRITLTANGIAENEDLILTARFSPDSLAAVQPQWQIQQEQSQAATAKALPIAVLAGVTTLLLGGLGLFTYARSNARDLSINPADFTASPPSDLSPAIVGKLTGQQHTLMGAIFDLAQRGALEIREEKGFWGKTHMLVRKDQGVALKPYEQRLLDALFNRGESQIKLNEVATRLSMNNKRFDESLEQELIQRGWFDPERKQRRTRLAMGGLFMMFLAMVVFFLSMVGGGANLSTNPGFLPLVAVVAGLSIGLFILSMALLIYSATYSHLTAAGEEQAARWKGFAGYLKQVSKGREPAIRPDYFEKYLAYAAVFGLGASWANYFQKLGEVPLPVWFQAMADSNADFAAIVAVMSASDSSGASAGGAGGAGASGGGSSGAG